MALVNRNLISSVQYSRFLHFYNICLWQKAKKSAHVGKSPDRLGKAFDGLVGVAMLYAVTDAVLDMTLENHLSAAVKCGLGCVYLSRYVLAWNVLIYHSVYSLHLSDYFLSLRCRFSESIHCFIQISPFSYAVRFRR